MIGVLEVKHKMTPTSENGRGKGEPPSVRRALVHNSTTSQISPLAPSDQLAAIATESGSPREDILLRTSAPTCTSRF